MQSGGSAPPALHRPQARLCTEPYPASPRGAEPVLRRLGTERPRAMWCIGGDCGKASLRGADNVGTQEDTESLDLIFTALKLVQSLVEKVGLFL